MIVERNTYAYIVLIVFKFITATNIAAVFKFYILNQKILLLQPVLPLRLIIYKCE